MNVLRATLKIAWKSILADYVENVTKIILSLRKGFVRKLKHRISYKIVFIIARIKFAQNVKLSTIFLIKLVLGHKIT